MKRRWDAANSPGYDVLYGLLTIAIILVGIIGLLFRIVWLVRVDILLMICWWITLLAGLFSRMTER
jgi:hypothetical protein